MTNSQKKYHKSEFASQQLKTAVWLLLNDKDLSSVITLSSACGNILSQLVRNSNQEAFDDYAPRVHEAIRGTTPKRKTYKNFMDNTLGVNVHKHMSPTCPETCFVDLYESAVNLLTKAIVDYVTLYGQEDDFVKAYLNWSWERREPDKIIELLKDMPGKLKKTEKWSHCIKMENTTKKTVIKQQ